MYLINPDLFTGRALKTVEPLSKAARAAVRRMLGCGMNVYVLFKLKFVTFLIECPFYDS